MTKRSWVPGWDGAGSPRVVDARMEAIRRQIGTQPPGRGRRLADERLARLAGRVGVIEIGAPVEIELRESIARLTGTVTATKAALAEGVLRQDRCREGRL